MEKIRVGLGERAYDILIGSGVRNLAAAPDGVRRMVVTDSNVAALCGGWLDTLGASERFVFPAGEESKKIDTVVEICRRAAALNFDRSSRFLAVGGGVTGDMAGFAAAIFMRGIAFEQIPTTLLAMVDSSVGGKTGVDIPEGKNLIGAFHQPRRVLIDPDFLRTLPEKEIRCGLAEIVKTAVLFDEKLFAELERDPVALLTPGADPGRYAAIIRRCCELKAEVVARDEREAGIRALLNYGHTFGHAVELLSGFSISHGEAVAIGMTAAAEVAVRRGRWSRADAERQKALLAALGLPCAVPQTFDNERIVKAMEHDKKNLAGKITLVLPRRIGEAEVMRGVPVPEIVAALEAVHA